MEIVKNKTGMTQAEAAHLKNGYGKNHNGGKYINPNVGENATSEGFTVLALFVFIIFVALVG